MVDPVPVGTSQLLRSHSLPEEVIL
jgi:hypothetical protein